MYRALSLPLKSFTIDSMRLDPKVFSSSSGSQPTATRMFLLDWLKNSLHAYKFISKNHTPCFKLPQGTETHKSSLGDVVSPLAHKQRVGGSVDNKADHYLRSQHLEDGQGKRNTYIRTCNSNFAKERLGGKPPPCCAITERHLCLPQMSGFIE